MKKQFRFLILLAFFSFSSLQLHAQNGTFTENSGTIATNSLWANIENWVMDPVTSLAPATGIATITTNADLGVGSFNVGEIIIDGTAVTISNGTLTIEGTTASSTNPNAIGNNANNATTIFDCDVIFDSGKRIRNSDSGTITFAAGKTVTFGTNDINLNNLSNTNPIEFQGILTGSGTIGLKGIIVLGSNSDFTGFTGTFKFTGNSNALLIVNGQNTIEGSIVSDTNGTAEVLFNVNQDSMDDLSVETSLALDFDPTVTLVQFSGIGTMTGVINLKNYTSGVLKIGTTATTVTQAILDTWLIDGVEPANGTIVQDTDGSIIIPAYTSTTDTGINWEDNTSWLENIAPTTATDNVFIQGSLIINSDVTVNNFSILSGGAVTVDPGKSLTVNGNAATNDNLFAESNATSFSSLIFNGTETGEIGYNRWVHKTPVNDLISSPVSENFGDIESSLLANPSDATQRAFGPFDNVTGLYVNWDTTNNGTTVLEPGKGYRAARDVADGTILFQAEPFSHEANVTIAITDASATSTGNYERWNLIGNPFPSYLEFNTFFTANSSQFDTGAFQAIYGYDGDASDGWIVWNNLNGEKLTPGQGFFVRSKTGGGTVTFTPEMRTIGSSDDFIAGRSSTPNHVLSELFLANDSSTYTTRIYFVENQTRGLDPGYDAGAYAGSANGIYTNLVENNVGIELAIQALPYNDFNDEVVPLGVVSDAATQLTIGLNATITTIPSTVNIYLEDNVTNTWTLLNTNNYVFTPSTTLNGTGRFYVHFSSMALSIDDNMFNGINIYTEQASKTVVVEGLLNADTTAVIYDMQGRLVLQKALNTANTTNVFNVSALKTGVYIVELKSEAQKRTQKIMIN
ncbi:MULTISPECIES: T9SS type A sorting domain-containing protein [Winogradskyella]|uniref:T9SS type A sorting domain-containing protein n=1 Tax=Winogradskyella TaxID=286104 RepID=UPI0015CDEA83|nr:MULTISPECIES: T9SS type A sorting domain-containing protein [Winogradskyella]QXP78586.1 T9SS type A sorting domain-containing protein [Winogradskyella sp. HaHa_3_26]